MAATTLESIPETLRGGSRRMLIGPDWVDGRGVR